MLDCQVYSLTIKRMYTKFYITYYLFLSYVFLIFNIMYQYKFLIRFLNVELNVEYINCNKNIWFDWP
jgi:hypothetical protein